MSNVVDNRVVEMRFDNKQFETGVATSMSTLEKLKQKLNFKGASKGLEEMGAATKKVNFSGLASGIETVHAKFSALEVMGVTALANITNSAVNAGKRMAAALTIDPVKTGFQEYETQMGAIQTILANTQKEGTNVEKVNAALDELNEYADKTIYNFTEMTRNIGTFTAAGVKLDTSVQSIKGIANLAAVSGSTSQQASTAMYQLSQALASGTVKLMDWNSVVNAGMGGQVFQDALTRTSELLKTGAKAAIEANGSFRESLSEGWLTSEVLTETLNQLAGTYTKAELIAQGYTEAQAEEIASLAKTAEEAATKVKTFTQLWDTLKEAAQSGWSQTWRMLVGDFEDAKERMTELSELFGGLIGKSADSRNNLLGGALTSKWDQLTEKLNAAGVGTETFQDKIKELANNHNVNLDEMIEKEGSFEKALQKAFSGGQLDKSILKDAIKSFTGGILENVKSAEEASGQMEKYGEIVDRVIQGDFGSGEARMKALTDAGYDYATIQNLVNEKMGNSHRQLSELSEEQLANADSLSKMSDEQLKSNGYTDEQIEALRELAKAADESGSSIDELIKDFDKPGGAALLWESLFDVLHSIIEPIKAVGAAWDEIFPPKTSDQVYAIVEGLNHFTGAIKAAATDTENLDKITRSFKGLFAALDIMTTIVGGGFKIAFKVLSDVLKAFDMNILDTTANIGDSIVAFRDWLFEQNAVAKALNGFVAAIPSAISGFKKWYKGFKETSAVKTFIKAFEKVTDLFSKLTEFKPGTDGFNDIAGQIMDNIKTGLKAIPGIMSQIGSDIIAGLKNGLGEGVTAIPGMLLEMGQNLINAIKGVLGIHSPSTVMFEVGENAITGLRNGLKNGVSKVLEIGKDIVSSLAEFMGNVDWGSVFAGGLSVGLLLILKKFADAFGTLASPLQGLGSVLGGAGEVLEKSARSIKKILNNTAKVVKSFSKILSAQATKIKADAVQKIAISLGILVGAIAVISYIGVDEAWDAVKVVGALAAILLGLSIATDKMSKASVSIGKNGPSVNGLKSGLLGIGAALLLLAITVKMVGSLDPEQAKQGFLGLAGLVLALAGVLAVFGLLVKGKSAQNIDKAGAMLLKMSISLLLLTKVINIISGMSWGNLGKGAAALGGFVVFVGLLVAVTKTAGRNIDKVGSMLLKLSVALGILTMVVKTIVGMSWGDLGKGAIALGGFVAFVGALVAVTKIGGEQKIAKVGGLLLSISVSMLLLVGVIKLIAGTPWGDLAKGAIGIAGLGVLIYAMLQMVKKIGPQAPKLAGTLLAMSAAIGILALVATMLGFIDTAALAKGVIAVGVLGTVMALMIRATKGSKKCKGNLIAMSVAIGVMAAAVAALSFIDGKKLAGATIALSTLMGMFALMTKSSGIAKGAMGSLVVMTLVVAALGGILYLLSDLEVESALGISASLSMMILSLSAACKILSGVGMVGLAAVKGIGVLALLITAVGGIMVALGALVTEFPKIGDFLNTGLPILEKIGYGLGSFFGNIITGFGVGLTSGLPQMAENLSGFMEGLSGFIDGAKGIDDSVVSSVTKLVDMMTDLTKAKFFDAITSWIPGASMEDFTAKMTTFAEGLKPVVEAFLAAGLGEANVQAAVEAAVMAGTMFAGLQNSLNGLEIDFDGIKINIGSTSLGTFGKNIQQYAKRMGRAVAAFVEADIASENAQAAIKAATAAGDMFVGLQNSLNGLEVNFDTIKITIGNTSLGTFGTNIKEYAEAMRDAAEALIESKISDVDTTTAAGAAIKAGEMFVGLSKSLEVLDGKEINLGNFKITYGDKSLDTFGEDIKGYAEAMRKAVDAFILAGFGDSGDALTNAIAAAANAGAVMAELQKAIPENHWLDGKVSLSEFGTDITDFGTSFETFNTSIGGINIFKIDSAIEAMTNIVELVKKIGDENYDINNISELDTTLNLITPLMKTFSNNVKDLKTDKMETAADSALKLKELISGLSGIDASGVQNFKIGIIGTALESYSNTVSDLNTIQIGSSIAVAEKLRLFIKNLSGFDGSGVDSFKTAVSSLSQTNMAGITESFSESSAQLTNIGSGMIESLTSGLSSGESTLTSAASSMIVSMYQSISSNATKFSTAGSALMTMLIQGIASRSSGAAEAISVATAGAVGGATRYYSNFYGTGGFLVSGFVAGIRDNIQAAANAAASMAAAASAAARANIRVASPSKVFYEIGDFAGQGFVNALYDSVKPAYKAGDTMADNARKGLSDAVSKIRNVIDSDMDMQPTIRPVLDLRDVQSGAGRINRMLSGRSTISVDSEAGSISVMMNQRRQNGDNSELVSAINKLRKDVSGLERPSYSINGVTYDDGSNIVDAVKTIINAAKVERRM